MGYRVSEQEEIMGMVKNGDCGDVLYKLDKGQVKRFPSGFVSRLILELIPRNTKISKDLAEMLLQYGKLDWSERDDDGRLIHAVMIRHGRLDLAVKAIAGLRRKDARDPELSSVWAGLLWWFLDKHQRTAAMAMLRKGVMQYMDDNERERALKKLLSYHDISLVECACRYIHAVPAELLCMSETLSERQFMRELLNRFTKRIVISGNEEKLWELALECEAANMAEYLLKKTKAYQYLRRLAAGSDEMFEMLLKVRCRGVLDDVKREVLIGALESGSWKKRFDMLVHKGWKKSSQNRKEDILLAEDYAGRIEKKRYGSGRTRRLEQVNDKSRLRFVQGYEQEKEEKKTRRFR